MVETRTFEITNQLGIHARVAAKLVETANRFQSEVFLEKDGVEVNGRSILGILTLVLSLREPADDSYGGCRCG